MIVAPFPQPFSASETESHIWKFWLVGGISEANNMGVRTCCGMFRESDEGNAFKLLIRSLINFNPHSVIRTSTSI